MDAILQDLADGLSGLALGRVDRMRRAQFACQLEAKRVGVDCDDRSATCDVRPSTAASPTEPQPNIAMLVPGRGLSEFMTAPAPVWIPQPVRTRRTIRRSRPNKWAMFAT